jgi:hypothetical protein
MLYDRITPDQAESETPVTVVYQHATGQVTVTDNQGRILIDDRFDGDPKRVLAWVDEMGITLQPSFKVLDKYAEPSEKNDQQVVWQTLPVEYNESNPTAEHVR